MQEHNISRDNFEQCLKCDICTTVCPMHEVNPFYPGPKQAGPDGERYRIKDPLFFDKTLKFCLNCKRCEVACPSEVKIGDIIQQARLRYGRQARPLRDTLLASTDFVGTLATPVAPLVNGLLGMQAVKQVTGLFGIDPRRTFPKYSSQKFVSWFRKEAEPQQAAFSRKVAYFHGCYVNYNYPQLGKDFVTLMNACGYGVQLLEKEKCCGVALISNGLGKQAAAQAKLNVDSIRKAGCPVLTTSSTCTFTIRDEYENVLGLDSGDMRSSVFLATRWLYDRIESGSVRLAFRKDWHKKIAYHTPCHMQKMGWQIFSTELLRMIPGAELYVPEQQCCGIAGTFGFKKENYAYSQEIGQKLFDTLASLFPDIVATDCETCKWQLEMSAGFPVMNPISILAEAIDTEATAKLNM